MLSIAFVAGVLAFLFLRLDVKDNVYALRVEEVNKRIDLINLPSMLYGVSPTNTKHWRVDNATSIWALHDLAGAERLRLSAITSPEGNETRVRVEVLPPLGAYHDKVEQNLRENADVAAMYKVTVAEQIDANLTCRDFDLKRLSPSIARVVLTRLPDIRAAADRAAKAHELQEQKVVDRAYANEK